MRWVVAIAALAVILSVAPTGAPTERRHVTGIALLPAGDSGPFVRERERIGEAAFEPLAGAWSDARELAEQRGDLFGVPWLDLAHQQVVVRLARSEGEAVARAWITSGYQRGDGTKPAPSLRPTNANVKLVPTTRSFRELSAIMNNAIDDPALGIRSGTSRIWVIGIDDESERVIFETDRVVDGFMSALATTYGTDVVAVRVDPRAGPVSTGPATLVPVANAAPFDDAARELGLAGATA